MNILVDGRALSRNSAGVSTFLRSVIMEWARQQTDSIFYVLLPKGLDPTLDMSQKQGNIELLDYSGYFHRSLPNIIILQLIVPYLCRKLRISLYYAPVPHIPFLLPRKTKKLVTIHDLVNIEMTETMSRTNRITAKYFFSRAVKKADFLWSNSFYTRSKTEQYFPHRKAHDIFVGCAVERAYFHQLQLTAQEKNLVRQKYGITGRFLLFVGTLEPRKNLEFLLRLMPQLYTNHGVQLVVVGGRGWKNSSVRNIVLSPQFPAKAVIFCGFVTNKELNTLYNTADCFVSASLMEGFGSPQLEALLCGCPVVTAHNTAMIEVADKKEGAYTVKGYNTDCWQEAILHVLDKRPVVQQQQLQAYDWQLVIRNLITFLEEKNPI